MSRVTENRALRLTYIRCELRHRWSQALATAAGLAVGVALVITVSAAASGTRAAQARVLGSLDHAASSNAAASTIGGAVATASGLAADLGTWVAAAALIASFAIATLLALASVTRRVREFGTLKALGWPAREITAQVLTETAVVGIAGTLAGVALGFAGTPWAPPSPSTSRHFPASIPRRRPRRERSATAVRSPSISARRSRPASSRSPSHWESSAPSSPARWALGARLA